MPPKASIATGIRGAYEKLGVQGFYKSHGHQYLNPHDDQIVKAVAVLMSSQQFSDQPGPLHILDLACGSGEATLALQAWAEGQQRQRQRQQQQQEQQQQQQQQQQRSAAPGPQRPGVPRRQLAQQQRQHVRNNLPPLLEITAADPYTQQAYQRRTGGSAHSWSFQDISDGCLAGRSFHLCVCSFALHLCAPSCLFITLYQLSRHCCWLAVLAPHKQPRVREEDGWAAVQALKVERVHVRLYRSLNYAAGQRQE